MLLNVLLISGGVHVVALFILGSITVYTVSYTHLTLPTTPYV